MNKAEEYKNIAENTKGTRWSRFYYRHVLRKCKKIAKRGYTGQWFDDTFFNPYVKNKLEDDGLKIKEGKGRKKGQVLVDWKNA